MRFKIVGNPKTCSMQEVRAILHACYIVLAYHNYYPEKLSQEIKVILADRASFKKGVGGTAWVHFQKIKVINDYSFSGTATLLLHEYIHLCFRDWDFADEKRTSTLTSRLKEDVVKLANILVGGTQKRAAYIAHTKISYAQVEKDHYDKAQWHRNHEQSEGLKYRRR